MENTTKIAIQNFDRNFLRTEDLPLFGRVSDELERLNVQNVCLTGSVVKGDRNYRDIDILVERSQFYPSPEWFPGIRIISEAVGTFCAYGRGEKLLEGELLYRDPS